MPSFLPIFPPLHMSLDPSQQRSHCSSLHYHRCWWAFCRHSFYSTVELLEHVNLEHVQNARPERLRDVPAHKLAEDDYWDSLDISGPPHVLAIPRLLQQVSDQAVAGDPTLLDRILSSLPSPPASTPHTSSPASTPHQTPSTSAHVEPARVSVSPSASERLSFGPSALTKAPLTPSPRRDFRVLTPTFSSLRSQPNSPSGGNLCIPNSPPFARLVEEATSAVKSTRSASSPEDSLGGGDSSQDSVIKQLTKSISDEENDVEGTDSTKDTQNEECMSVDSSPLRPLVTDHLKSHTNQRSPISSYSSSLEVSHTHAINSDHPDHPDSLSYPSSLATPIGIGTPTSRQFWYQAYRRPSLRRTMVPDSGPPPSLQLGDVSSASLDIVQSSSPVASVLSSVSQSSLATNQSQSEETGQSQSEETEVQMDTQLTTSYPPLLTQAPYHSQDMTQSQD